MVQEIGPSFFLSGAQSAHYDDVKKGTFFLSGTLVPLQELLQEEIMIVCIAEKPSVARDIAQVLGATTKRDGYIEGNGYQVTWTFGHLCTLKEPHDYTPQWKGWDIYKLPMIPPRFGIKLIENPTYVKQFKVIEQLMQQADMIDSLDIPDYKLFGYPEWQIYAKDTREQMYEVETYFYATFYSHYSIPEITRFQEEYIKRYDCSIQNIYPRYGMLGYDTGYFFLLATSIYGEQLSEKINELEYNPIQTGFRFERLKNGAMINKNINFIHYTPDYRIEKIDFKE